MRILAILTLLTLLSCTTQEEAVQGVGYFDIEEYIKGLGGTEINRESVQKVVKLNGKEEREEISSYNILPELNMMNKYNINKPALAGKYSENKEGNTTVYRALEDGLITRTLKVKKSENKVTQIEIEGLQQSILSESQQTIIFAPEKSFFLKSEDKNKYTKDITKEVLIEY